MKNKHKYNWIAEVARLIPGATFRDPLVAYRDRRTRIVVIVNENAQTFVISNHPNNPPVTPEEVLQYFSRDDL